MILSLTNVGRLAAMSCVLAATLLAVPRPARADLRAGAARVSITPDPKAMPYPLGGYVTPDRVGHDATGIHDSCYARALVLASGSTRCAIVSLDLCFMPANVKTAVVARIGATGVPADALFLCATHTHSAPDPLTLHAANTEAAGTLPKLDPKLLDWMAEHISQAIAQAAAALQPARVGSGQMSGIGLNRNRRGEKLTDDEMTCLKVTSPDGKPIAALFDYAAHPVYYGGSMLDVSGDWSGAFERQLEAVLPGAVALFVNGAEGDASPNGADEGTPAERIETYSAKLMQKALALYGQVQTAPDVALRGWVQQTELGPAQAHPFFLLAAAQFRASKEQASAYVARMMPPRCQMSFLSVGDALFMGFPGEPTAAIGLRAKALAREHGVKTPVVTALTNGWHAYIVTPEQYHAGKYEATMSFYGDQVGEKMLAGLEAGLAKLPAHAAAHEP